MGLDICIYKISQDTNLQENQIIEFSNDYLILTEDDIDKPFVAGLKDYVTKVLIPNEDDENLLDTCYVAYIDEIAYWRNDREIQKYVYNAFDFTIENTGFYELRDDMLEPLGLSEDDLPYGNENFSLFYYEWY